MAQYVTENESLSKVSISFVSKELMRQVARGLRSNGTKRVKRRHPYQVDVAFADGTTVGELECIGLVLANNIRNRRYSRFVELPLPKGIPHGSVTTDCESGLSVRVVAAYSFYYHRVLYRASICIH
jgi:hypothetical protein